MKLEKIINIEGILRLETGLHIGANDSEMRIGGVDNKVLKDPITDLPYIPGSSIKGKLRSLMEWRSGAVQDAPLALENWKKETDQAKKKHILTVLKLFGVAASSNRQEQDTIKKILGPARLSFWDCFVTDDWKEKKKNNVPLTEAKSENTIDRISAIANPRQMERVSAGVEFKFRLSLKKLDMEGEDFLEKELLNGLRMLELDSLGGSGSRGYGKVKFDRLKFNGIQKSLPENPFID